jgi:membrane protease YdiL (CAAX protease family)
VIGEGVFAFRVLRKMGVRDSLAVVASSYRVFAQQANSLSGLSKSFEEVNITMKEVVKRRWFPWDYLIVTFGFSWLCWLPGVLGVQRILGLPIPTEAFLLFGIFGPLVGAIVAIARRGGWAAIRRFLGRVLDVRIGVAWWLVILAGPLFLSALAWLGAGLLGGETAELEVVQKPWILLSTMLLMMVLGGGQEEFGWRGYALDILQSRWSALAASVVLGVIWGVWHLPLFFVEGTGQYYLPFGIFVLASPALSILTTWVYNSTGKRLFAAVLFHGAVNTGMTLFPPIQQVAGGDQRAFLILSGLYWMCAVIVISLFGSRRLAKEENLS